MRARTKAEFKQAMRDQARHKVRVAKHDLTTRGAYREEVEKGLGQLRRSASEGGDSLTKKIKGELTYLLNNYLPQYDARIEQLIDEWRRSGDPSYDPGIRIKLRQARRDHMTKAHPA